MPKEFSSASTHELRTEMLNRLNQYRDVTSENQKQAPGSNAPRFLLIVSCLLSTLGILMSLAALLVLSGVDLLAIPMFISVFFEG